MKTKIASMYPKIIFLITFSLVTAFLATRNLSAPGDDGKFYFKMAAIEQGVGLIKSYPWLYFTQYREQASGLHFLYPLLLVPFTTTLSPIAAFVASSAFFLACLATLIWSLFMRLGVKYKGLWLVLGLAGSQDFIFRHSLGRPITTSLFMVLCILYLFRYKLRWLGLIAAIINVWVYDGYLISIAMLVIFAFGIYIIEKQMDWKSFLAILGGFLVGNILNPFFPNNIRFLHTFITVPLLNSKIQDSNEWMPSHISHLVATSFLPVFLLICASAYVALVVYKNRKITQIHSDAIAFGMVSMALFGLTLIHRRFIEYFAVFSIIFFAATFKQFIAQIHFHKIIDTLRNEWLFRIVAILVIAIVSFPIFFNIIGAAKDLTDDDSKSASYERAALYLKSQSTPKTIVFNVQWDQFANLFYWDSDHYYINGLDPDFLHSYSPELYLIWKKFYDDDISNMSNQEIIESVAKFDAKYIFIESDRSPVVSEALSKLSNTGAVKEIYSADAMIIYEVK
jgi:hypothetical protein